MAFVFTSLDTATLLVGCFIKANVCGYLSCTNIGGTLEATSSSGVIMANIPSIYAGAIEDKILPGHALLIGD
jgi:hypothetical protein